MARGRGGTTSNTGQHPESNQELDIMIKLLTLAFKMNAGVARGPIGEENVFSFLLFISLFFQFPVSNRCYYFDHVITVNFYVYVYTVGYIFFINVQAFFYIAKIANLQTTV